MSEVLSLSYEAAGPSITGQVDAVNANGVTVIGGKPMPAIRISFAELYEIDAALAFELQGILGRLEPILRERSTPVGALASVEKELEEKRAVLASLDRELSARKAERRSVSMSEETKES